MPGWSSLDQARLLSSADYNTPWDLLLASMFVFMMQLGFAMLETGVVRAKNAVNILTKNCIDVFLSTMAWWCTGYMFAFGKSRFGGLIGLESGLSFMYWKVDPAMETGPAENELPPEVWFFQLVFCSATSTIVSGGVAERAQLTGYTIFTLVMTGIIYPVVVSWVWNADGWLVNLDPPFVDFAGSGVVHLTGGMGALVGAQVLGARFGRFFNFSKDGSFRPNSLPLCGLGTFILWVGWYGFNCGSAVALGGEGASRLANVVAIHTTMGAVFGGIGSTFCSLVIRPATDHEKKKTSKGTWFQRLLSWPVVIFRRIRSRPDFLDVCNGILGGLVAITAPCASVTTPYAAFIGFCGGILVNVGTWLLILLQIDDPIGAWPVHGFCGSWGIISTGLFDWQQGFLTTGQVKFLGIQVLGVVCIASWAAFMSFITFYSLKKAGLFRVKVSEEIKGLDAVEEEIDENRRFCTFLSHKWEPEDSSGVIGGENHRRCLLIHEALVSQGFSPWLDTDGGCRDNITSDICAGIDKSDTFTVVVTKEYCEAVMEGTGNYCGAEFNYANLRMGAEKMCAIVLSKEMLDTANWAGPVGFRLGGSLYVDFSEVNWGEDDDHVSECPVFQNCCYQLGQQILRRGAKVEVKRRGSKDVQQEQKGEEGRDRQISGGTNDSTKKLVTPEDIKISMEPSSAKQENTWVEETV